MSTKPGTQPPGDHVGPGKIWPTFLSAFDWDVLESLVCVHDALPAALAAKLSRDWMDQRWLHGRHQALQGRSCGE